MRTRLLVLSIAGIAALAAAPVALAHGLPGDPPSTVWGYIWLGIRHMVAGWDHLLFVTGVVILAREPVRAAKLLSLFVVGHSTTLLAATVAGIHVNAGLVDVVIALSVAFVGWRILRGQPTDWRPTIAAIAGFGLVHGLGLATRLQELRLPEGWTLVGRVLAFNLGVEIGQLLALTSLIGIGLLVLRLRPSLRARQPLAAGALVAAGVIAAAALSFAAVRPDSGTAAGAAACEEEPYTPALSGGALGGHPEHAFFEPTEEPAEADLLHVMGDGYIIVSYNRSLADDRRAELRSWVEQGQGVVGVPGDITMTTTIEARTRQTRLTCDALDVDALDDFRSRWFTGS